MREIILCCGCHKINEYGELYSCLRQYSEKGKTGIQTIKTNIWNKLNGTITKSGYIQVVIHSKIWRLNRLIAINFIKNNNPQIYYEVNHIDDNKLNNKVSNLKWGNPKTNAFDRIRNGNNIYGDKSPNAKINDKIALEIFNSKLSLLKIANKYSVSKKLVLLIKQRKIWKHIHKEII